MRRFGGYVMKSASFHKIWSPHSCTDSKVASISPRAFINLRVVSLSSNWRSYNRVSDPELHSLNDTESRLLSEPGPRSSIIQSRVQKSASFHKTEGRVPFIKLKNTSLCFSQTNESCILSKGQCRVSLEEPEPCPHQTAESHVFFYEPDPRLHQQFKAMSPLQTRDAS